MTTRWPTSGSANGSSPTLITPWPAPDTWTTPCWLSPSTSGAGSTITCHRRKSSNLAERQVVRHGPFEHSSTLKLIESTFGLKPLTARDANAENLGRVLRSRPRRHVPEGVIPTSAQVLGPVSDAAAICSVDSVQSVSPEPVRAGKGPRRHVVLPQSGSPTGSGMVGLGRHLHKHH